MVSARNANSSVVISSVAKMISSTTVTFSFKRSSMFSTSVGSASLTTVIYLNLNTFPSGMSSSSPSVSISMSSDLIFSFGVAISG